ncbi:hypothetical protein COB57_00755 [Candidatus Peregrinibacteria bacterium]|nr:MAG: hypothetical protein COB57_00755 [Candidatus Peregrinibacteria bacterium]
MLITKQELTKKQATLKSVIKDEGEMALNASEKYGVHFIHAAESNLLLYEFLLKSHSSQADIALMFLSQVKSHHTLALLSCVRRHRVQTIMNLRQVQESGIAVAYRILHENNDKFYTIDSEGVIIIAASFKKKTINWIKSYDTNFASVLHDIKKSFNDSTHVNLFNTIQNSKINTEDKLFESQFFDYEDEYAIKIELFEIANLAIVLLQLFYKVCNEGSIFTVIDDFSMRLKTLEKDHGVIKNILKRDPRYLEFHK